MFITVRIPPLRERASDLALLANCFLRIYGVKDRKSLEGFPGAAMGRLQAWQQPGKTLSTTGVNKQRAADLLGTAARTIYRKLDQ